MQEQLHNQNWNEAVVFRCHALNAPAAINMHIGSGQCQVNVVDVRGGFVMQRADTRSQVVF